jgi:hypothetical protein
MLKLVLCSIEINKKFIVQLSNDSCLLLFAGQGTGWKIGPSFLVAKSQYTLTRVGEYLGKFLLENFFKNSLLEPQWFYQKMLGPKILFNHVNTRKFKEKCIAVAVGGWNLLDPYSGDLPFIEV